MNFDGSGVAEFTIADQATGGTVRPGIDFKSANEHFATINGVNEWDVIKGLSNGSTINSTTGWHDKGDAYIDPVWAATKFPTGVDKFIGAKFNLGSNAHFGWIRVNWDGNGTLIIKDFAYENTPNTPIIAGDIGSSGTPELFDMGVSIYPNPSSAEVNVDLGQIFNNVEVKVRNTLGQIILTKTFKLSKLLSFEITESPGVYFVEIRTDKGNTRVLKVMKE